MADDPRPTFQARRQERRRRRDPLYFPERRTGFDRRTPAGWRGRYLSDLREMAGSRITLPLVLATIVVLNLMDYLLTLRILALGGIEANPIMARLFDMGLETAALAKLGIVGIAVIVLLALRRYRRTLELSLILLLAYSVLMLYHIMLLIRLWF